MDTDLQALIVEQRAANERARRIPAPRPGAATAAEIRHGRLYKRGGEFRPELVVTAYDEQITTHSGTVLSRIFPTAETLGTIVHFHGGGWALGSVYEQDAMLSGLSRATKCAVVSIDYPLAPEVSLPRALDVAAAALRAVAARQPTARIALIGESAGAHVGLIALMRLRTEPELLTRVRAAALNYGIYDLAMTPSQRSWGNDFLGLSTPWLEWFYEQTLPDYSREQRADPSLSPLYADLKGLPPTMISVGRSDPLLDDSLFLFDRLEAVGNEGLLRVYPEAPHGFNHSNTAMARCCNERVATFLYDRLAVPTEP